MITPWRKSTKSGTNGGNCVEMRRVDDVIQVRDSKNPGGPTLSFSTKEWEAFLGRAKDGEFDR